jgi:hypothetical protein
MKLSRLFSRSFATSAVWILIALAPVTCAAFAVAGAATNQTAAVAGGNSKTNGVAGTNAAPVELPVPLAEFELTIKPTKDPFFPNSTRQPVPIISTNTIQPYDPANFTLKGLSGTRAERLALVNNRTVAKGETSEVNTPAGKIKIRCIEIKEYSVIIMVDGQTEPIEISLRKILQ